MMLLLMFLLKPFGLEPTVIKSRVEKVFLNLFSITCSKKLLQTHHSITPLFLPRLPIRAPGCLALPVRHRLRLGRMPGELAMAGGAKPLSSISAFFLKSLIHSTSFLRFFCSSSFLAI
jgi:hypothetical protein